MQAITPPGPLLQLTLFLGVLAEFTSGSILDWLVSTTALLTGVTELKSHEAMLMLNLTGALVDGVRSALSLPRLFRRSSPSCSAPGQRFTLPDAFVDAVDKVAVRKNV